VTNIGPVIPDERHSVWPRPPAYAEATAGEPAAETNFGRGTADRFIEDNAVKNRVVVGARFTPMSAPS
jgi:hypothetical protein